MRGGDLTDKEPWFKQALSRFKSLALEHMDLLVQEVLKARAAAVEQMVSNVRIVVATMDAWCKYRAGCVRGIQGNILDGLKLSLALIDEYEANDIVQVHAACGCGLNSFETVLFLGDEHQRLEGFKHNPAFIRHPWVGDARDRTAGLAQSENVTIDQRGVEVFDTSRCTRTTETSNPGKRAIHEWLKDGRVPFVELTWCKRCGENVCQFISEAFPFAKNFKTDTAVAPDTWF